jgi:hypothetical protein
VFDQKQSYAAQPIPTTTRVEIRVARPCQRVRDGVARRIWAAPLWLAVPLPTQPGGLLATSESTRARRFALPNLVDQRTDESIEAFIDGPDVRRGRGAGRGAAVVPAVETTTPAHRPATPARPSAELRTLPGRLEWNAALERESVRASRYRRPASVAIVELKAEREGVRIEPFMPALAGPVARLIRQDSRASDLVARVASARFQLLLPETTEGGAERLAERLAERCRAHIATIGAPVGVRVSVAGTGLDDTLHEALAHALRAIEAA